MQSTPTGRRTATSNGSGNVSGMRIPEQVGHLFRNEVGR
jgi:hypothetical protein